MADELHFVIGIPQDEDDGDSKKLISYLVKKAFTSMTIMVNAQGYLTRKS